MFHAPTAEAKTQKDVRGSQSAPEPVRELSPFVPGMVSSAWSGAVTGGAPPRNNNGGFGRQLAGLHSMYGNQAVLRALSRPAPVIQTKLTVNKQGDEFEQEADRVADQVMRMTAPTPSIQRKCSGCEEEEKVQRKCAECEEEEKKTGLQRKEAGAGPEYAPPSVHSVLSSPGRPLDPATRAFMEPRFGHDFSGVRVHTDASAADSARAVNALAFTAGPHVVFGSNQYAPGTAEGKRLLAHELTHVVQQSHLSRTASASPGSEPIARSASGGPEVQRKQPCECNPQPVCNDAVMSKAVGDAFGEATKWVGPAEQKMTDFKAAPTDPKNAAAAKALKAHFSWDSASQTGPVKVDIPGIVLKVIADLNAAFGKCTLLADCPGTTPAGPEGGKVHAGSPNAWAQTNCYEFYEPFKKDNLTFAAQIALHEMVHSWEGVGAIETYEGDAKYPPPPETAQNNPDSFACLIRDLRK